MNGGTMNGGPSGGGPRCSGSRPRFPASERHQEDLAHHVLGETAAEASRGETVDLGRVPTEDLPEGLGLGARGLDQPSVVVAGLGGSAHQGPFRGVRRSERLTRTSAESRIRFTAGRPRTSERDEAPESRTGRSRAVSQACSSTSAQPYRRVKSLPPARRPRATLWCIQLARSRAGPRLLGMAGLARQLGQ